MIDGVYYTGADKSILCESDYKVSSRNKYSLTVIAHRKGKGTAKDVESSWKGIF